MRWRFLLLVFGISLIVLGCREIMLRRVARSRPQTLSCAALGQHGPGDNAHVELRDFRLCDGAFVYEEKDGRWTQAWVPAVPGSAAVGLPAAPGGAARAPRLPPPEQIRVLVKMPHAHSVADVVNAAHQETLQGLVVNEIERLGPEEKAMLERSYPGVDFDSCWIFELGREPAGLAAIAGSLGGGAALIVFMLWTSLGSAPVHAGPLAARPAAPPREPA